MTDADNARLPTRRFGGALIGCLLVCWLAAPDAAAEPQSGDSIGSIARIDSIAPIDSPLPPDVQLRLARTFAPVLAFHPLEKYFPVSPLFTVEGVAEADARAADDPAMLALLGTAESRRDRYEALTLNEKAALATVFYRAYHIRRDSRDLIVVEYWFYYVQNTYRVRGNLFPFWMDGSHPNDLEHLHVVLRPAADGQFVLDEVYASSHEGTMPANRYHYTGADTQKRGWYLVEHGSHALAPDIDEDGVFTPGVDGNSGQKFVWGIRDRGLIWPRYKRSYMDDRQSDSPRVFEYADTPASDGRLSYRLVAVEKLTSVFASLDLSTKERKTIFETDKFWVTRMFGSNNGSSAKLLVPPARPASSPSIGIRPFARTERGFLVGATFKMDRQGVLFGARYGFLNGVRYLPDVVFQVDGRANALKQVYVSGQGLLSYPIDGTMKVFFGRVIVADLVQVGQYQWDWTAGVEFRLGRMRINGASRSWGPITQSSKEFSLSYFF